MSNDGARLLKILESTGIEAGTFGRANLLRGNYAEKPDHMNFDQHGYLIPYDLISTDLNTINQVFVDQLPDSTTRRRIFTAFSAYLTELQLSLPTPLEIWVNGSFTTLKPDPNDIDFVIFVDSRVAAINQALIRQFRQRRYAKEAMTDGYFAEVVPETHPDYRVYQFNRADRHRDFGFDRLGNPKGYLQLLLR